jgi:D-aminopeptidase
MAGAPLGIELGRYSFRAAVEQAGNDLDGGDGSVMIVVATDAPLSSASLERVARRAIMGLARTGSSAANGSGDYVIAFSTHPGVRREGLTPLRSVTDLSNDAMSGLFQGVVEATEEAIYNSLLKATSVSANGITAEALPIDSTIAVLRRHGITQPR